MELFENKVGRPSNEIRSKRKKFIAGAVTLSLVAIFAVTLVVKNVVTDNLKGAAMGNYSGDIDGSGSVNDKDLDLALKHIAKIQTLKGAQLKRGDTNKDGKIDYTDAKEILRRGNYGKIVGDANNDKKVTEEDARLILRYASKLEKYNENQRKAADMNKDGNITAGDARLALIKVYGTAPRRGDLNKDGKITMKDAQLVLQFVEKVTTPSEEQKVLADVNADGKITKDDYKILQRVSSKLVGDVDDDGIISLDDVTKIVKGVSKISKLSSKEQAASDINGDKKITMKDARILSFFVNSTIGDANGDGRISKEDAILVAKYASKQKVTNDQKNRIQKYCDINGDKKITMTDARLIYRLSQD